MLIKGRYPLMLFVTALLCAGLLVILLINQMPLFEAACYSLVFAAALYVLYGRGAATFLLKEGVLHVYPLLSRSIVVDTSNYVLVDYRLNFFSLDRKSNFFFTGMKDTLIFFHRETNAELSVQIHARMSDTRLLIKTLLKPAASAHV